MKEPTLTLRNVSVIYNSHNGYAVSGINLQAHAGEMVLLIGPNGGGKSTILKTIVGLVNPSAGEVLVLGKNPSYNPEVRRFIGYVPQLRELNIYAPLTVRDLVAFGRYPRAGLLGRLNEEDNRLIEESIRKVKLEHVADRRLSELSGGQLARAVIARALAQNPLIYLLDEPFESIDKPTEELIMDVLKQEKQQGKLIVVTEHHIPEKESFDKIVLVNRSIIAAGKPSEVLTEENLQRTYNIPKINSLLS